MPEFIFCVAWMALGLYLLVQCDAHMQRELECVVRHSLFLALVSILLWPLAICLVLILRWARVRAEQRANIL